MGHPIHKHMHGSSSRKSAEGYDAKEAYNKDLSSKARMHYLENDIADKKGMSRHSSPLDNVSYGDKSGVTGYIGEQKKDLMKYNPVDDRAGMSRHSNYGNSPANGFRDTLKKVGTTAKNLVKDVGYQIGDMISPDPGGMAQAMSFGDFRSAQNDANRNKKIERKVHDKSIADAESGKSYFSIGKAVRD